MTKVKIEAHDLLMKTGGAWLAAMREWVQCKALNGERIRWYSQEIAQLKPVTMRELEELASRIAATAINEYAERAASEARWKETFEKIRSDTWKT